MIFISKKILSCSRSLEQICLRLAFELSIYFQNWKIKIFFLKQMLLAGNTIRIKARNKLCLYINNNYFLKNNVSIFFSLNFLPKLWLLYVFSPVCLFFADKNKYWKFLFMYYVLLYIYSFGKINSDHFYTVTVDHSFGCTLISFSNNKKSI